MAQTKKVKALVDGFLDAYQVILDIGSPDPDKATYTDVQGTLNAMVWTARRMMENLAAQKLLTYSEVNSAMNSIQSESEKMKKKIYKSF